MTGQSRYIGGTFRLLNYNKLWNVGVQRWVEIHLLDHPIVPVLVEEILGDPYAPEVTHYAWEDRARPRDRPAMVQIRAGTDPSRAMMFLNMCFACGIQAAVAAGQGKVLALRITERAEETAAR